MRVNVNREEYRLQADYCMRMADDAVNEEMMADWLRLAAKWLAMIPKRDGTIGETLENGRRGQASARSSH